MPNPCPPCPTPTTSSDLEPRRAQWARWARWGGRRSRSLALAALLGSGLAPAIADAALVHDPTSRVLAYSRDSAPSIRSISDPLSSLPLTGHRRLVHGANVVDHMFEIDAQGIELRFDHVRGEHETGNPILPAVHSTLDLRFTVDAPTTYELMGAYEASDPIGKRMYYQVNFTDQTAGRLLYTTFQDSQWTADEAFVLGEPGGDWLSGQTGRLLGELLPGHDYKLWVQVLSSDMLWSEESTSQASGFFQLIVLPEPSTALLVGFGLAFLPRRRRSV